MDGKQEELFSTSKQGEPHITRVSADTFALAQDKKSVLISTDRSREMQVVNWSDVPQSVGKILLVYTNNLYYPDDARCFCLF